MGVVYEVLHQDLGKRAALKTLHSRGSVSDEVRERFLREGQAAARIRHPNVADVYDVSLDGSTPFLVMELLEGHDLSHHLAGGRQLSLQQTADWIIPVVAAVGAAHAHGLVHRDLKPGNVFLANVGSSLVPKVLDFGISKVVDAKPGSTLTKTGAFLGTPHYMSPEQALGSRDIDARSDQYALGVILFQCVTGRRPLEDSPMYVLMHRTIHGEIPSPRQFEPNLPEKFEALILRAMAQHSHERFASAHQLGEALLEFASPRIQSDYEFAFSDEGKSQQVAEPKSKPTQVEQASTLGQSVHIRSLALLSRSRYRLVGSLTTALALIVGIIVFSTWKSEPLVNTQSAMLAVQPQLFAEPSTTPEIAREVAVKQDYAVLRQRAEKQLAIWLRKSLPSDCVQASELWRVYEALSTDEGNRRAALRALKALGECRAVATQSLSAVAERTAKRSARKQVKRGRVRPEVIKESGSNPKRKLLKTPRSAEPSASPFLSLDGD